LSQHGYKQFHKYPIYTQLLRGYRTPCLVSFPKEKKFIPLCPNLYWQGVAMNLLPLLPNLRFCHFLQADAYKSVGGVATNYGLDCPRTEFRWVRDFPHPSRQTLRPNQLSVQWIRRFFFGDKAAEAWHLPPTRNCPILRWSLLYYLFRFVVHNQPSTAHCTYFMKPSAIKTFGPYSVSWLISRIVFIFGA